MERGLYSAATGMLAQQTIQDYLAQNIANAATIGYKQENATFRAAQGLALSRLSDGQGRGPRIGELGSGVNTDTNYTDWKTGPLTQTGNLLDASLGEGQFFTVQTPQGERYTRAGGFQTDSTGALVTVNGQHLLDVNNRPVVAPLQGKIALDNAGNLTADGQVVTRLKIVEIAPNQLEKAGDTQYAVTVRNAARIAARPVVRPGTLEQSNMNVVQGLVRMITVQRGFDMAQRAITTQDELLKQATTEVGKL